MMPTMRPPRSTGSRLIPCVIMSCRIAPTSASSGVVTTGAVMTSRAVRSARTVRWKSAARGLRSASRRTTQLLRGAC